MPYQHTNVSVHIIFLTFYLYTFSVTYLLHHYIFLHILYKVVVVTHREVGRLVGRPPLEKTQPTSHPPDSRNQSSFDPEGSANAMHHPLPA